MCLHEAGAACMGHRRDSKRACKAGVLKGLPGSNTKQLACGGRCIFVCSIHCICFVSLQSSIPSWWLPYQHPPIIFLLNCNPCKYVQAAEVVRAVFLSQHPDKLRPFITPAVEASITARASTAPPHLKLPDPVTQQPECIKAVMREYQVSC